MRRLLLGSLAAAVSLSLAGCGRDDDTVGTPTPEEAQTSLAPSSSPSTPNAAPSAPPEPPAPTVAPATGPVITGPIASLNVPVDYNPQGIQGPNGGNISRPDPRYNVQLSDRETSILDESIDYLAKQSQENSFNDPPLKRQSDVTIAGQPAYHLAGRDTSFPTWAEEFGFRYQGHTVVISISTPRGLPQTGRDALNAAVLASVTLRP